MSKFGIIYSAYNTESMLRRSLAPWVTARGMWLGGHEFVICGVSCPFVGFDEPRNDETLKILHEAKKADHLDHLIFSEEPIKETEARGQALNWLVEQGCDTSWIVDSDEIYNLIDIEHVIHFTEARPYVAWFRLSLKNYVFDTQTYLVQPFTPPRIHRIHPPGHSYIASGFWDDNNLYYRGLITKDIRHDISFSGVTVPSSLVWVPHLTWLSDERSKSKVFYHQKHFKHCSFRWDTIANRLAFDETYFVKQGLSIPEIAQD